MAQKELSKSSFNTYYKNENSYLDFTFTDFITDGIDAKGDGDLDPSDRTIIWLKYWWRYC